MRRECRGPASSHPHRRRRAAGTGPHPRDPRTGASDVEIVGEAGDGLAAAQAIEDLEPDLVFLDIRMPEMDGFGVLAALRSEALPLVVFVTAFDAFAVRAFAVHAVDYILKPFDSERLIEAVERARSRMGRSESSDQERRIRDLMEQLGARQRPLERLLVKAGSRFEFVRTADVDWIEAAGNYVTLHVGARAPLLRCTLSGIEHQLDPERFRRIHRCVIVNLIASGTSTRSPAASTRPASPTEPSCASVAPTATTS